MSNLFLPYYVVSQLLLMTLFLMSFVYCLFRSLNKVNRTNFKFVICSCFLLGVFYFGSFITLFQILNLN